MDSLRYIVLLLFLLANTSYSKPLPSSSKDVNMLKSFLIAKDPNLSKYSSNDLKLFNFTVPLQVPLFTRVSSLISINSTYKEDILDYISLDSKDFYLQNMPQLYYQHSSYAPLDLVFSPSLNGYRSDYLTICTSSEMLVYYLQGFGEESKYKLKTIYIEYYTEKYGIFELMMFNP